MATERQRCVVTFQDVAQFHEQLLGDCRHASISDFDLYTIITFSRDAIRFADTDFDIKLWLWYR